MDMFVTSWWWDCVTSPLRAPRLHSGRDYEHCLGISVSRGLGPLQPARRLPRRACSLRRFLESSPFLLCRPASNGRRAPGPHDVVPTSSPTSSSSSTRCNGRLSHRTAPPPLRRGLAPPRPSRPSSCSSSSRSLDHGHRLGISVSHGFGALQHARRLPRRAWRHPSRCTRSSGSSCSTRPSCSSRFPDRTIMCRPPLVLFFFGLEHGARGRDGLHPGLLRLGPVSS